MRGGPGFESWPGVYMLAVGSLWILLSQSENMTVRLTGLPKLPSGVNMCGYLPAQFLCDGLVTWVDPASRHMKAAGTGEYGQWMDGPLLLVASCG